MSPVLLSSAPSHRHHRWQRPPRQVARLVALLVVAMSAGLLLLSSPAQAASAGPPGLTPRQQRVVLDLVDDTCGDTWCEGDYAFEFRRFSCDASARTCTMGLRIARRSDQPLDWFWRSDQVRGFVRFEQMVTTSPSGYRSLDPRFYEAVSRLISRVEASVPERAPTAF